MKYVIFEMINANLIDFSLVEQTSLETLRLSIDTTKCVLKFKDETYDGEFYNININDSGGRDTGFRRLR